MIEIISGFSDPCENTTRINGHIIHQATEKAIEAIKNELPEEAQTVEVMGYIISEISQSVKERKIVL